jgi:glycosyltransferase involved in cell wall biosynthesis
VDELGQLPAVLGRILGDDLLRSRLSRGALARARWFTWDAAARRALEALAEEATPGS